MEVVKISNVIQEHDDSPSIRLLTLIAMVGELPDSQAHRVVFSPTYLRKIITKLKGDNLIRTYYKNNLRGYRLTACGKKVLAQERPERAAALFSGKPSVNRPKYSVPDRLRLHRMAEVTLTMLNADIAAYPWEKPALFDGEYISDGVTFTAPQYYTSFELKEIGEEESKIRGSRATGVLLTPDTDYIVYNTGGAEMEWKYQAEVRLKTLAKRELGKARMARGLVANDPDAIIFARDMSQLPVLMDAMRQRKHDYFVLDGNFKRFFYLINDQYGELLVQFLCDRQLRKSLDDILVADLRPGNPNGPIENDGYSDDGSPVLVSYLCDMPRIKRFDNALTMREKTGTLLCFDFQEPALRQICSQNVKIQTISFEAVKGGITDQ